jgi:hypothetical protein
MQNLDTENWIPIKLEFIYEWINIKNIHRNSQFNIFEAVNLTDRDFRNISHIYHFCSKENIFYNKGLLDVDRYLISEVKSKDIRKYLDNQITLLQLLMQTDCSRFYLVDVDTEDNKFIPIEAIMIRGVDCPSRCFPHPYLRYKDICSMYEGRSFV